MFAGMLLLTDVIWNKRSAAECSERNGAAVLSAISV
jgi:hypothetical protein